MAYSSCVPALIIQEAGMRERERGEEERELWISPVGFCFPPRCWSLWAVCLGKWKVVNILGSGLRNFLNMTNHLVFQACHSTAGLRNPSFDSAALDHLLCCAACSSQGVREQHPWLLPTRCPSAFHPQLWQPKMSSDIAKCLGGKIVFPPSWESLLYRSSCLG